MKYIIMLFCCIYATSLQAGTWEFYPTKHRFQSAWVQQCKFDSAGVFYIVKRGNDKVPIIEFDGKEFKEHEEIDLGYGTLVQQSLGFAGKNRQYYIVKQRDINSPSNDAIRGLVIKIDSSYNYISKDLPELEEDIYAAAGSSDGDVWFVTKDGNIYKYTDEKLHSCKIKGSSFIGSKFLTCQEDKLYANDNEHKTLYIVKNQNDYKKIEYSDKLSKNGDVVYNKYSTNTYGTHDGEVLMTFKGGQVLIWRGDSVYKSLHIAKDCPVDSLVDKGKYSNSRIHDCFKDYKGNYWFIYDQEYKKFIVKYNKDWEWEILRFPEQLNDEKYYGIHCMHMELAPDGKIWFLAGKPQMGIYVYDPKGK